MVCFLFSFSVNESASGKCTARNYSVFVILCAQVKVMKQFSVSNVHVLECLHY